MFARRMVVFGSLSQDFVVNVPRLPAKGETIRGTDFGMFAGGKGNNQAMAAARAGGDLVEVVMVGRVGADQFGDMLIETLKKNNVDTKFVSKDETVGTGIALITVDAAGDNNIVIAQRSNLTLSARDAEKARSAFDGAVTLMLQLEVPFEANIAAAKLARECGHMVHLNPAPAPADGKIPDELWELIDVVTPNQTEVALLTGMEVTDLHTGVEAAQKLKDKGPKVIILTMGDQGCVLLQHDNQPVIYKPYSVNSVDATAAGDAFCGALAAGWTQGLVLEKALERACAAGALATTKMGAEPSLPTKEEIEELMKQKVKV